MVGVARLEVCRNDQVVADGQKVKACAFGGPSYCSVCLRRSEDAPRHGAQSEFHGILRNTSTYLDSSVTGTDCHNGRWQPVSDAVVHLDQHMWQQPWAP